MTQAPPVLQKRIAGAPLLIETISSVDDWSALAVDWQDLVQRTHQPTPFLTYEFQRAWWQYLGGGEWKDAELNILTGRDESGRLVGIAPLFRTTDGTGEPSLRFIGSHEIADFLDFISQPDDLPAFIKAVCVYLGVAAGGHWQRLELENLLDSSASLPVLKEVADRSGCVFELETLQPSPYIQVPESLDAYIESLGNKQGHELRRKLRRAARNPEPISLELIKDKTDLPSALEDFFGLMRQEADKDNFLTPVMQAQMRAIAQGVFDGGWLQLFFLKAGTERIAAYLNFDYDNSIWAYNAGFHNAYSKLSPGWLIMAEMVRWSAEHGRKIFDFMRGGEEYKYRFGAVDRFVQRAVISRVAG